MTTASHKRLDSGKNPPKLLHRKTTKHNPGERVQMVTHKLSHLAWTTDSKCAWNPGSLPGPLAEGPEEEGGHGSWPVTLIGNDPPEWPPHP